MDNLLNSLPQQLAVAPSPSYLAASRWDARAGLRLTRSPRWRTLLSAIGLLGAFVAFLTVVQFATPNLAGNDGYYHIRMAYVMRTEGLKPLFDWLPLTILNAEEFVDHHFLYHVALIPFTFGDLRLGAKIASVIFPALTFLAIWWLLRGQEVPYAGLWSLGLLAVSEAFIYRMSMPRAQALSLGVLVLAFHWMLTNHPRRLLPLAFIYVWLYNAFPLLLVLAAVYAAGRWLIDRRVEWRVLAYAVAGIGLGLILNPYVPHNLLFITRHIGPKIADPTSIKVGSEWYPYKTTQLMENSGMALIAFLAGILAMGLHTGRMQANTAASLLATILFGGMLFQSRRFVEYFPPFALIFAAFATTPILRGWLERTDGRTRNTHGLGTLRPLLGWVPRGWVLACLITVTVVAGIYANVDRVRHSLQNSKPHQRYAGAAAWLSANTPQGSRVFQTDWDDFPRLFFYNTHNTYTVGLDPTYMQLYDPELFELWVDISQGRVDAPSRPIWKKFGSAYVMTDLKHAGFLDAADEDPALTEVYRDDDAAVLYVTWTDFKNAKE